MISPLGDVFGQWPRAGWGGEDEFDRAFDASFATADQAVVLAKDVESEADADRCVALLRPRVAAEGFEAHTVQGDVSGSGAAAAGRLRVGEQVVEVSGGEFLATGEAGTLIEDDQSGVPFKVRNRAGDTHWYSERDLQRPAAVSGAAASSGRFVVGESVRICSVAVDEARRLQDGHGERNRFFALGSGSSWVPRVIVSAALALLQVGGRTRWPPCWAPRARWSRWTATATCALKASAGTQPSSSASAAAAAPEEAARLCRRAARRGDRTRKALTRAVRAAEPSENALARTAAAREAGRGLKAWPQGWAIFPRPRTRSGAAKPAKTPERARLRLAAER